MKGAVLDVVLDLRPGSASHCERYGVTLRRYIKYAVTGHLLRDPKILRYLVQLIGTIRDTMILDTAFQEREVDGRPIRVRTVGAGATGGVAIQEIPASQLPLGENA